MPIAFKILCLEDVMTPKWDDRFRLPRKLSEWLQEFDEADTKVNVQHHGEARISEHSFVDSTLHTGCSCPRISIADHGLSFGLSLPHHMRKPVMVLSSSCLHVICADCVGVFSTIHGATGCRVPPSETIDQVLCRSLTWPLFSAHPASLHVVGG